jgi:hypothetical protein
MTLCYNFKASSSAICVPALYDDLPTFTLIPYLEDYNKNISIEQAIESSMNYQKELSEEMENSILLGYVKNREFKLMKEYANTIITDDDEIKALEDFVKELINKDFSEISPEFVVLKCFPYCIDLPLQYGYIVNKYTEIAKYNMYVQKKYQFVVVTELDFEFEDNNGDDVLSEEILNKLVFK